MATARKNPSDIETRPSAGKPVTALASPEEKRAALMRNIAIAKARAWMPEIGDIRTGQLIGVRKGQGEWDAYPILVFADVDDNGTALDTFYTFHAFHGIAGAWLAENKPALQSILTISALGLVDSHTVDVKTGQPKQYHDYFICFGDGTDMPEETAADFGSFEVKVKSAKTE